MTYRKIDTGLWNDSAVIELHPEGRYAYVYLLTAPQGNMAGCFECSAACMSRDTGISRDAAEAALAELVANGLVMIDGDTSEVLIENWHTYQWGRSPKVAKALAKTISDVRSPMLREILRQRFDEMFPNLRRKALPEAEIVPESDISAGQIPYPYGIDRVPVGYDDQDTVQDTRQNDETAGQIPYPYGIDTVSIPYQYPIEAQEGSDETAGQILYPYGIDTVSVSGSVIPISPLVVNQPNLPFLPDDNQQVPVNRPTIEEVESYAESRRLTVDCKAFCAYNDARGWSIEGKPIRSWKSLLHFWADGSGKPAEKPAASGDPKGGQPEKREYPPVIDYRNVYCPECGKKSWYVGPATWECPSCGIWREDDGGGERP